MKTPTQDNLSNRKIVIKESLFSSQLVLGGLQGLI